MAQPSKPTPQRAAQGAGYTTEVFDETTEETQASTQDTVSKGEDKKSAKVNDRETEGSKREERKSQPKDTAEKPTNDEQVAQAREEVAQWQDKFMRLHAEWDTYRRRTIEQRAEEKARAAEKLVLGLLPVIDDFERTIDYASKNGEQGLLEGVNAVHTKFVEVLTKDGVEIIDPEGQAFDALEAQAVGTVEDKDSLDETVAEVYQKGYRMGTKVLRPAMVTVTSGGPKRQKSEEEEPKQ